MIKQMIWVFALAAMVTVNGPAEAGGAKKQKKNTVESIFKKLDTDGDGQLSPAEFGKMKDAKSKKPGNAAKKPGKGNMKAIQVFAKLDTNNDGFISFDEFKKMSELKSKKKGVQKKKS